jgi:hypothetical protein
LNGGPLIAAEGYFFCLDTKEAKNQVSKKASLQHRPCAANRTEPLAAKPCPNFVRSHPELQASIAMPLLPTGQHVLPDFAQSFFADIRNNDTVKQKSPASLTYKTLVICTSAYPRICTSKITSSSSQ